MQKQRTYISNVWNPAKSEYEYYEIPMPEYESDFTSIINGIKTGSMFAMVALVFLRFMGVM